MAFHRSEKPRRNAGVLRFGQVLRVGLGDPAGTDGW